MELIKKLAPENNHSGANFKIGEMNKISRKY